MVPAPYDPTILIKINAKYNALTDYLGLLRNNSKDASGHVVEILSIEIDSLAMAARLSFKKLAKAIRPVTNALTSVKLTQLQAQKLAGFLNFCTTVVPLGRTFYAVYGISQRASLSREAFAYFLKALLRIYNGGEI